MDTPITGRELILTRIIDAPPARVFKAWTDPEQLKQWFASPLETWLALTKQHGWKGYTNLPQPSITRRK